VGDEPVLLSREDHVLHVRLNRPARHNAFGRAVRDGLLAALEMAELDPSITELSLTGKGRSFCSGGDLDEFGTTPDVSTSHVIRLATSVGLAVHRLRDRVRPVLHGACIGAGIEVPAFAAHVVGHEDATFALPEVGFGLVPGAGGTVSVTKRIGRWRTAYLALTGERIGLEQAVAWGLVDGRA
jgi:enoyl-CoA hydratase/carnithine racemase